MLGGKVADYANDDIGLVLPGRTIDRHQPTVGVKIVLDKIAVREFAPRVLLPRS